MLDCWWGLGLIILGSTAVFVIGIIALPTLLADVTIRLKLFALFGFHLSLLYPMSAVVLIFVCVVWYQISCLILSDTRGNVRISRLRNEWKVRLIEWRKAYLVIGELVDKITSCFGPVMLISLISMFARVIQGSFFFILTLNS